MSEANQRTLVLTMSAGEQTLDAAQALNTFTGPQGKQGETGATPQISVEVSTGEAGSEAQVEQSGTAEKPVIHLTIPRGDTGNTGATPVITFKVATGEPGTDVQIEQSGTAEEPEILLTIPRGDTGAVEGLDYYTGSPAALGEASPGTANGVARGDHVHPMPSAEDVGALPNTYTAPVQSVNGQTGGVNVSELRVNGAKSLYPFGDDTNGYGFQAGSGGDGTEFNIGRFSKSGHVYLWEGGDVSASGAFYTELNKPTPSGIGAAPTSHASSTTTYGIGTSSNYGHVKLSDSTSSTSAASAGIAASPAAVKSAYDLANGKAPTSHASTATTYGIGTGSNYGHVKLSDSTSSTSAASAGIAASPAAVKAAYDLANGKATRAFYTGTLTTSGWSSSAPYTQSITVSGILATDTPVVDLNMSSATASTAANLQNAWSYVGRIVTAANKITAYCYTNKPTVALPINILVLR